MNNLQAFNGSSRQLGVASELLRFVSQSSCEERAANLAPSVTFPASFAPLAAAAPFCGFIHSAATSAASAPSIVQARLDCNNDGNLHAPPLPRTPCLNRPIDHTYTDFALISDAQLRRLDFDENILNDPRLSPEKKRLLGMLRGKISRNGGLIQSFPPKLHAVISKPELSHIISWLPHGRAFVVNDPDALVKDILPNYFNQTKFVSFVRQLNLWGFKRVSRETGKTYYHELFLRGRPYMALKLTRYKVKGHGFKPIHNPNAEPNFYHYSHVGGENNVDTPVSKEQMKDNANLSEQKVRSKKKIMMSRASADAELKPAEVTGLGDLLPGVTSYEKPQVYNANDGNYLASAISKPSVPPVASNVQSPSQAQYIMKTAENASHADLLLHLGERNQGGISQRATFSVKSGTMDDFLTHRLTQIQREQAQIELIRRARMLGAISASHNTRVDPYQFLSGLERSSGLNRGQNISNSYAQLAGGSYYIPQANPAVSANPFQISVSEVIREANQLEEMAIASRNRVRLLAAMGSGYDVPVCQVTEPEPRQVP